MSTRVARVSSAATAEDVARMAGVSVSAVSRAFTPGGSVSARTKAKVMAAAQELAYSPNLIARSLIRGRSNIVGVGAGNLANPFLGESLVALSRHLVRMNLRMMLFPTDDEAVVAATIQEILQYKLDALVLLSTIAPPTLAEQCQAAGVPLIHYNARAKAQAGISGITTDNVEAARLIAAFLEAGGHRQFAFIGGIDGSEASRQRHQGFLDYLHERGHRDVAFGRGEFNYADAACAVRRLLVAAEPPDAIFCANDIMALAALDVARFEFGLEVGREISIVGFDDIPMASWPSFSLTTFSRSVEEMVMATAGVLADVREGAAPAERLVPGSLIIRDSARRPGRSASEV